MKKIYSAGFVCLVFLTTLLQAQSNFISGTIIKSDGTTLSGLINFQEWEVSPSKIEFKSSKGADKQIFTPKEITSFDITGIEKYISAKVDLNVAPIELEKLTTDREPIFENTTIFLRMLVESRANLFYHIDEIGKEHFFFKVDNAPIEELIFTMYHEGLYEKEIGAYHRFRRQLIEDLADCPSLRTLIDMANYDRASLQPIIESYNVCVNEEIAFTEREDKSVIKAGLVAGIGVTRLNFQGVSVRDLGETQFTPQATYYAGVYLSVLASRGLNRFSIENELMYHNVGGEGRFENIESDDNFIIRDTEIQFNYLQYNHLWRYTRSNKLKPFVNGGLSIGALVVQNKNNMRIDSEFFAIPNMEEIPAIDDIRMIDVGSIVGAGLSWKQLSAELRLEIGKRLSNQNAGPKERTLALILRYEL